MEALSKGCWIKYKGGRWMGLGKGLDSWLGWGCFNIWVRVGWGVIETGKGNVFLC